MSGSIDAVYSWIDERPSVGTDQRLRYSLRSLERNAPWIRKVYLATNGQPPAWLDPANSRVTWVDIPPTSSLGAIEWRLHRIAELSRRLLYLHPDCFLGRRATTDDFVTAKGGYRVFVEKVDITPADAVLASTEGLLNGRFGNHSPRKKPAHAPRFLDRDFLEELERLWSKQVKQTVARSAPQPDDVSMETLFSYYLMECPQQMGSHEAVTIGSQRKNYVCASLGSVAGALATLAGLAVSRPKVFCLRYDTGSALVRRSAHTFLQAYYPRQSSFERAG